MTAAGTNGAPGGKSAEEIAADILAALPESATPPVLFEQMTAVNQAAADRIERFRFNSLYLAGVCCEDIMAEHPGLEKDAALRVIANQYLFIGAFLVRSLKRRAGNELSPARFALVAYGAAETVLAQPWDDQLSSELTGDGGSLREMLEDVIDEKQAAASEDYNTEGEPQ